jgi:hypothetical protein
MSIEVRDLHHIQDPGARDLLNPWLGNYLRFLLSHLTQAPMWCEHCIVISVSEVEAVDIESWDQSQLASNCVYPLWEVHSDENALKLM